MPNLQLVFSFLPQIAISLLILWLSYLLGQRFASVAVAVSRKVSPNNNHEIFLKMVAVTITVFIGLVIALSVLGLDSLAVTLMAGGGVTAVIWGFAFREIGENFLAGVLLSYNCPFKIGDDIGSDGIEGKVVDIKVRYTHLKSSDGRDIFVPSSHLFKNPLVNFTKDGLRRNSFTVGIDYSNDSKAACTLLQKTVSGIDGVLEIPKPGAFIQKLEVQFVEICVFYWININVSNSQSSSIRTNVIDSCRKALLSNNYIVSADTTSRIQIADPLLPR